MEGINTNRPFVFEKTMCDIFVPHGPAQVRIYESYVKAVEWYSGRSFSELTKAEMRNADFHIIPLIHTPHDRRYPKEVIVWAVLENRTKSPVTTAAIYTLFEGVRRINERHPLNPEYFVRGYKWLERAYKGWYDNLTDSQKFRMYYDNLPPGAYLN